MSLKKTKRSQDVPYQRTRVAELHLLPVQTSITFCDFKRPVTKTKRLVTIVFTIWFNMFILIDFYSLISL